MNRIERKLLFRTGALGLLLTLTVVAADVAGWLAPLDRWLWDRRARWCQVFSPPPTDRIVHVMIDDDSLQTIGAWPWPRSILAGVIDELSLAGAKVIALDIFFPEPQQPTMEIDHDRIFAESIAKAGNVLLPNSVEFRTNAPVDPLVTAAVEEFERDVELKQAELRERLLARGIDRAAVEDNIARLSVEPRQRAILRRISRELAATTQPDELRARIIPKSEVSGVTSDAANLFEPMLDRARAVASLRRFGMSSLPQTPLVPADGERSVSIMPLMSAAAASGFVDLLSAEDSTVRALPLYVNYRGMAWPTMAFTLACLELDTTPAACRIERDQVIIPARAGERHVPVRLEDSQQFGEVGTVMDIPWTGDDSWLEMYRGGDKSRASQFLPIKVIWTIGQLKRDVVRNNAAIDDALLALAKPYQVESALKFLEQPPHERTPEQRAAAVAAVSAIAIDDPAAAEALKMTEDADPATLSVEDRKFLSSVAVLRRSGGANAIFDSLIADTRSELRRAVEGKITVIGWSATGKLDVYPTSIHTSCPGSVIQGALFNAIVTNHMLRSAPRWIEAVITLGIGLMCTAAVARFAPWTAFGMALALAVVYALLNGFLFYDLANVVVGAAGPLVAALAVWSLLTLFKFINETRERSRITRRFRSYVDPALVDYVIEHPEKMNLAGEVREVTVAFTDLAGFTSIAESLQERAVPILNQYMGLMVPIIRSHGGLVNKFLGDGIMFFYGAPREHPQKAHAAVETVLEMNRALLPLNEQLTAKKLPLVNMRAGIATGKMVVGDAGAIEGDQQASDYTVLGDRVNLAARLEAANKPFGSAVLIEQRTYELIHDQFLIRPIGKVRVKGKDESVRLYEPLCSRAAATARQMEEVEAYTLLIKAYERGEFERCLRAAGEIEAGFGLMKLLELYRSLCEQYIQSPETFAGDIVLTEK